eukprot:GHVQ01005251.1.p1 GENE.GHVQ01005251.1~~GHVQ01005251.1.p1  ORF type:complete len:397 (-),score=63.80 GHVQ01005251.1:461-1651(-)
MPPVKKRSFKRYTFEHSKFDCLSFRRRLCLSDTNNSVSSNQSSCSPSCLPHASSAITTSSVSSPANAVSQPFPHKRSSVGDAPHEVATVTPNTSTDAKPEQLSSTPESRYSSTLKSLPLYESIIPSVIAQTWPEGDHHNHTELPSSAVHTGLPPLPTSVSLPLPPDQLPSNSSNLIVISSATEPGNNPRDSLSNDDGSGGTGSPPLETVNEFRTRRISEHVRRLVINQRADCKERFAPERQLSQRIRAVQAHRRSEFAPPRSETERQMRTRSLQGRIRNKQIVKRLLLQVVGDCERVRRLNRMKRTEQEMEEERDMQRDISRRLYGAKRQVMSALYRRMLELRGESDKIDQCGEELTLPSVVTFTKRSQEEEEQEQQRQKQSGVSASGGDSVGGTG